MKFIKELKTLKLKKFLLITLAGIINAFGITMFLSPVNLYDSGISGTSMLLERITPEFMSLSLFLVLLNIPLFIFGYKRLGTAFTVYAIYSVIVYSLSAWVINDILPIDVSVSSPFAGQDLLLCSLFGGVISGLGSGLTIRAGGAMDGIEVMAVIFAKKLGLTVGTFVMIYNVALYLLCGIIFQSWILPLYSVVTYCAALKTVDFMVEGIDRAKAAMIVTVNPEEVCRAVMSAFGTGATTIEAKGGYSNSPRTVVYFVVNRFQIGRLRSIVQEADPTAYVTISDVADIFKANN
ncbi:MAG: YitT family protein [Ruminiclostridium sp.]